MGDKISILCVDDEENVLKSLKRIFMDEEDYTIFTAICGQDGLDILEETPDIQIIVADYRMPGMNGVEFLQKVYEKWPDTIRIVLSGYAETASIVDAINKGHIYKFIPKPWNDDELRVTISNAIERYLLYEKNKRLTKELGEKNAELQGFNESLEALVRERTADLEFKNQALQRSHKILDSLPVAVAGVDPEGMIVYANQKAFDVVGMDKNVLGKDYRDCLSEEASQFLGQVFGKAIFEGSVSLSKGVFYIRGSRFYSGKDLNGFVLVFDRQEDHE